MKNSKFATIAIYSAATNNNTPAPVQKYNIFNQIAPNFKFVYNNTCLISPNEQTKFTK